MFDKSARDSIQNFEAGNGDVAITYENEVQTANEAGLEDEAVYPPSTVLIENPVAIVDKNADDHCVEDVAEAFVEFLHTPDVKALYTRRRVPPRRPTSPRRRPATANGFPPIEDLFTVDGPRRLGRAERRSCSATTGSSRRHRDRRIRTTKGAMSRR